MKAMITGADGFIGSHLTELLFKEGYDVTVLSQYNSFNNWGWIEDLNCINQIEVLNGDIRDSSYCNEIFKNFDVVFNLAALIAIPYSYKAPRSYLENNTIGSFNVAESCYKNNVKKLIHVSTSEVYGTADYVPIDEKHPKKPQSPYSASKIAADAMVMSFFYSFELPITIARPFNTYGPRQSARAIIPTIISQIISNEEEIVLGDLTPTRDLNYVKDTCRGIYLLSRNDNCIGKTVNVGSNKEISMQSLLELICEIMNKKVNVKIEKERIRPKNSEVKQLLCDNSILKELTNFKNDYSLKEGLIETINWFSKSENLLKYKSNIYNI